MNEIFNFKELKGGEIDGRKRNLLRWGIVLMIMGVAFLAAQTIAAIKETKYIGSGIMPVNTISVSGEGEVFAVPDIAEISFTVHAEKKAVSEAQNEVTAGMNAALDFVKKSGIEEKDIKTTNYSAYPRYEYINDANCLYVGCPRPGKQTLAGYDVTHTVMIKIRDMDKVGEILDGLGKQKISDLSGPNFSIDDDNKVKADARKKAIDDAKAKAKVLSKDLRVKLVRIVSFSESGNYPMYAKAYGMGGATDSEVAVTPDIPRGENKITSNVTITYEIR